jgi:hypothetical protein
MVETLSPRPGGAFSAGAHRYSCPAGRDPVGRPRGYEASVPLRARVQRAQIDQPNKLAAASRSPMKNPPTQENSRISLKGSISASRFPRHAAALACGLFASSRVPDCGTGLRSTREKKPSIGGCEEAIPVSLDAIRLSRLRRSARFAFSGRKHYVSRGSVQPGALACDRHMRKQACKFDQLYLFLFGFGFVGPAHGLSRILPKLHRFGF